MANLFDYLEWRGEIPLSQVPLNGVDNLILSALVYVHFQDLVPTGHDSPVTIGDACAAFTALSPEEQRARVRTPNDMRLAEEIQNAPRFARLRLVFHRDTFDIPAQIQFAAVAILLEDDLAYLAYRGTDNTLVGWKEDFNMSFQEVIPGQRAAAEYLAGFCQHFQGRMILGGHSKGGNLAVYAAATAPKEIRNRIDAIYNNDGPGFFRSFLDSDGYQDIRHRIQMVTPQSSIVGLFLEHDEPYTPIESTTMGIFQHDPYSWCVMRGDFIRLDDVTAGSRILDKSVKRWLAALTPEERAEYVDAIYDILSVGELRKVDEFFDPRNVFGALKSFATGDEATRSMLLRTTFSLARCAGQVLREGEDSPREERSRRFKLRRIHRGNYFRKNDTD